MAENFYDSSFFPQLQIKSPDAVGALGQGYDLGRKMYVNDQLPGLMQASANGDINARAQAQALDPSAAYQAALGNQAQTTAQQTQLLTTARLANGLSDTLKNSADDTAKQSAIDAFAGIAKQAGVQVPPSITDTSIPIAQREATVHNIAQQTQSTMYGATLGKGDGSLYIQQRIAQGVPPAQAAAEWVNMNPRNAALPNGTFVQNSPFGPQIGNPTTGQMGPPMATPVQPALSQPQMPVPQPPAPSNAAIPAIDGNTPAVPIAGGPIATPQASPAAQAQVTQLAGQDQGSVAMPPKPQQVDPLQEIQQAKQTSIQSRTSPTYLSDGSFMLNGAWYPKQAVNNPKEGQEIIDQAKKPFEDLDSEIKAAQTQILLAKQVQTISPNADSGEIADILHKAGSTADSLGLLPGGSKASQDDLLKAITAQYAAGIMGGENNVKNVRNVREFDTIMAQAPQLMETAAGRDKIAQLSQAVAQAKLQSAQAYQQAVSDQTIANPNVKQSLQDNYGKSLDAIPVYGISHYDDPQYADKVRQSLEIGSSKSDIINMINKQGAGNANP